jgi:hypothetical protein
VERLGEQPGASIPAACSVAGETKAAYLQLGYDTLNWSDILGPHLVRSRQRIARHAVVLCLQDTTELDFNGRAIDGLGRLSYPRAARHVPVRETLSAQAVTPVSNLETARLLGFVRKPNGFCLG